MANRYWVGGAGTWNSTSTTNWSASSGGGAGASAPTSVDDVFFNSASNATAYAVTIGLTAVAANCRDVSISGPLVGNVTITSAATAVINCYGSWLNAATGVAFTTTTGAAINFLATTTGKTITANGIAMGTMALNMNATGGGWTLGSALSTGGTVTITAGSFSTGGSSYSMSLGALASSNSNVRSINLNASTVSLSGGSNVINFLAPTNLTFNAGTSNITFSNANTSVNGGGQTFYNVTFSQVSLTAITMTGANTFNNLTFPVKTNTGANTATFGSSITVTGTFTAVTSTYNTRLLIASSALGTPITITAGAVSLAYVDVRDITGAGTATWTGTSIGNCLGNTNITFDTPKTVYWNLAGAQAWGATAWATTAAGTPAIANLPLAQDTATFTDSGAALSVSAIFYNLGTIDTSTRTLPVTFGTANLANIYGDVINGSGLVYAITGTWTFFGRSTQTITSAGVAFTQPFNQGTVGGILRLQGNCTTAGGYTLSNGTLDLNGFDLSVSVFASTNSNVRSIAFGTNKIILTGSGVTIFNTAIVTNFTATGTPQLEATYAGGVGTRGFTVGAAGAANAISINVTAGTDTLAFGTTNGAFNNLTTTGFTGSVAIGNSIIFYGDLDFTGVTAYSGTATLSFFAATGTQDINLGGVTYTGNLAFGTAGTAATYRLTNNVTIDTTRTVTLTSGTLNLNDYLLTTGLFSSSNSNVRAIDFATTGYMVVSGNATTVWNTDTATNFSIVGTSYIAFNYAGSVGTRTVYHGITNGTEANSPNFTLTTGSDTFNVTGSFRKYGTLDFSGFAGTISFGTQTVYGSLSIAPAATVLASGNVMTFGATSGPKYISVGITLDLPITFDGVDGTWELTNNLTVETTRTVTLTNGTVVFNNFALTTGIFSSSNSNVRTLDFTSNGTIDLSGNNTTVLSMANAVNLTVAGTAVVRPIYTGSVGTRTFASPLITQGGTEDNSISLIFPFLGTASTDTIALATSGETTYKNIDLYEFQGVVASGTSAMTIYGYLQLGYFQILLASSSAWRFAGAFGGNTIASAARTLDFPLIFDSVGGSWQLLDALTVEATKTITLTNGTLDASLTGFTTGAFSSSNSNIRGLTLGPYIYTITGTGTSWNVANVTNLTFVGATSGATISMISAGANTFSGGLIDWPDLEQLGTGTLTVAGGGSFNRLYSAGYAANAGTILFTGGASYSFGSVVLIGAPGYLLTIGSTSTTPATLSKPTAWLMGVNSVDAGNNTGLTFGVSDGFIDYVSASYIDGRTNTTFSAHCNETATGTDILTPKGIYGVVLAADTVTATDSTTRGTLWNVIDTTQIPGWTPVIT